MRVSLHGGLLLSALALAAGCGGSPPPVASLEVERSQLELPHRRFVALALAWQVREPLPARVGELKVFVHLLDGSGNVMRTFDHPWPRAWHPRDSVEYALNLHQSALAPPLDPGAYALTIGLYDGDGERWPLAVRGEAVDRYEYRVAEVRVPPESGDEPMYQFSPEWLDSEAGRDRQVLARRWLTAPGRLRVLGPAGPGVLWLGLHLPNPDARQELVLAEDAVQQGAVIRSECGGVEVMIAGPGDHDVQLPLEPAGGGEEAACEVEVVPNFYLMGLDSLERRALSLDVLAWSARPD